VETFHEVLWEVSFKDLSKLDYVCTLADGASLTNISQQLSSRLLSLNNNNTHYLHSVEHLSRGRDTNGTTVALRAAKAESRRASASLQMHKRHRPCSSQCVATTL
jgi:hypothetical protein